MARRGTLATGEVLDLPKDVSHVYLYIVSKGDEENCSVLSVGPRTVDLHSLRIYRLWRGPSFRFPCQCLSESFSFMCRKLGHAGTSCRFW